MRKHLAKKRKTKHAIGRSPSCFNFRIASTWYPRHCGRPAPLVYPRPHCPHASPLPCPRLLRFLRADPLSPGGEHIARGQITPIPIVVFVIHTFLVEDLSSSVFPELPPVLPPLLRTGEESIALPPALLSVAPCFSRLRLAPKAHEVAT